MYYILKDHEIIKVSGVAEWDRWFGTADRVVANDVIGNSNISTIFLGMDHSFNGPPPLLFETMVFGGPLEGKQDRCATWEQAEKMHADMCERVRKLLEDNE